MNGTSYAGNRIVVAGGFSGIGAALLPVLGAHGANDITVPNISEQSERVERFVETNMGHAGAIDTAIDALHSGQSMGG